MYTLATLIACSGTGDGTADTNSLPLDTGSLLTWHLDADGDGFGDPDNTVESAEAPANHVADGTDCDDADPTVSPGAEEVCDDGIDDDCDGWDSRCRLEGTISLADAEARYLGDNTGDTVGDFFVCGGDTNGDGSPELLIGETEQYRDDYLGELSVGGVWLVTDWETGSHDLNEDVAVPLWGNVEGWYRGGALTFLHNPLGDGYDGVMLGSSEDNAAYIYYGPITAPILPPDADAVILNKGFGIGDRAGDFGDGSFVITNTGDLADDSGGGQDVGKAFLFTEPPSGTIDASTAHATLAPHTDNERGYFGWSLCSSDLDGDGVKDLAIGMPAFYPSSYPDYMSGGAVYVIYGPFEGDLQVISEDGSLVDADARIESSWESGGFGRSISCGGDTDLDGLSDLLVGAPDTDPGYAFLYQQTLEGLVEADSADGVVEGTKEGGYSFGKSVSLEADMDGDDLYDVVIGSGYMDTVYLFYGGVSGTVDLSSADVSFEAAVEGDYPGTVAGCPDMDGDGIDDLLIGGESESTNGLASGAAYLILGGGG